MIVTSYSIAAIYFFANHHPIAGASCAVLGFVQALFESGWFKL